MTTTSHKNNFKMEKCCAVVILSAFSVYLIGNCNGEYLVEDKRGKPCSFYDTVNLTGIEPLADGSYVYDGVAIPRDLVDYYDYEFVNRSYREPVMKHLRGCICKLKPCINLCCPRGQTVESTCVTVEQDINSTILVTSGTEKKAVDMNNFFVEQVHMPCGKMFMFVPQIDDYDEWILFVNGTLYLNDSNKYVPRNRHCFIPHKVSPNDSTYIMNPMNCLDADPPPPKDIVYSYALLFSIPFMILTIIVYLAVPELCNMHGKTVSCYLGCLVVGYSVLSFILHMGSNLKTNTCALIGYPAYFFFMSSYFWLSVISFDLWWNFRGTRNISRLGDGRRFLLYSCYAWGLAAGFSLLTYFAQHSDLPENWKIGIGSDYYCWIKTKTWSGFIYFYGPLLVIILVNIIFFILTSVKIYTVQKGLARMVAGKNSKKNLRKEKDKFWTFLRLFVVMGGSWLMEVLSYMLGEGWDAFFYVSDVYNACVGFIIFVLFVMRRRVLRLIMKRLGAKGTPMSTAASHSMSQR